MALEKPQLAAFKPRLAGQKLYDINKQHCACTNFVPLLGASS